MKYEFASLEILVTGIITGSRFSKASHGPVPTYTLLKNKTKHLEKTILQNLLLQDNETIRLSYFTLHMQKLVELCDKLYDDEQEKETGLEHAAILMDSLANLKKAMPGLISRNIALPKLFRVLHCPLILAQWESTLTSLFGIDIDPVLREIMDLPVAEFCGTKRKLSWFHFIWLKKYMGAIEELDLNNYEPNPGPAYLMHEVLIKLNFNHSRFAGYCYRMIQQNAEQFKTWEEQEYVFNMAKKIVLQLATSSAEPFYPDEIAIGEDICKWIDEELRFRSQFDAEVFHIDGKAVPVNHYKHVYNMKAEQLAFWQKLQLDHQVYEEDNLDVFCDKVAYNSSTKNKDELSPGSIKSKLYSKDPTVIKPIYDLLGRMQEDIKPFIS